MAGPRPSGWRRGQQTSRARWEALDGGRGSCAQAEGLAESPPRGAEARARAAGQGRCPGSEGRAERKWALLRRRPALPLRGQDVGGGRWGEGAGPALLGNEPCDSRSRSMGRETEGELGKLAGQRQGKDLGAQGVGRVTSCTDGPLAGETPQTRTVPGFKSCLFLFPAVSLGPSS